ncbi:hypothetical protein ACFL6Q_03460 [Candidatus Neomarinimicrobiota bacterium]
MKCTLALLLLGLPLCVLATDDDTEEFLHTIGAFVNKAPMIISYHYALTQDDFHQDTTGTLILMESNVFRLTFWDKIYGSDGTSLYVHDKNTRQTIIDSLRWTELHPWLRILNGELPPGTRITQQPSDGLFSNWLLTHLQPMWICTVIVDTLASRITEIRLQEGDWEHVLRLDVPLPYANSASAKLVSLDDLPGIRLDLR